MLRNFCAVLAGFAWVFLPADSVLSQRNPTRDELMKAARDAAAKGMETSMRVPGKDAALYVFYNKPNPVCFSYSVPGEWEYGREPGTWVSKDRQQFVGVFPYRPKEFQRQKGDTLVERAATFFIRNYEKRLKQRLSGTTLTPFEAATVRTWKLFVPPVNYRGREAYPVIKYIIEVGSEGLLVLTVGAAGKEDELARRILSTVKTSTTPPCFLPLLEELYGIMTGAIPALVVPAARPVALTDTASAPPHKYNNPRHPWAISSPGVWKLVSENPNHVRILQPGEGDQAGCEIFSLPATQFAALDDFADQWLRLAALQMSEHHGVRVLATSRRAIPLPNDVTGIEVVREIQPASRSRAIFILSDGMGYVLDCESPVRMWDSLAPLFEQIISSFTLEKKP